MNYFEGLTLPEDIKSRYKELAKKYHPDRGGCVLAMTAINNQYEKVLSGVYQKAGKSITEIEELLKDSQELMAKLCDVLAMPGVSVEICGNWLWVTGNTKSVKDLLKSGGFFWSSKKLAWYWRKPEEGNKKRFKTLSLEEIRSRYGSEIVKNLNKRNLLA